jgi:hypothetical protein
MGTLYAEGLQRLLTGLSTYSRRRLSQAQRPDVDSIEHLPAAPALRLNPPVPGQRGKVGTMSEVLKCGASHGVALGFTGLSSEAKVVAELARKFPVRSFSN